MIIDKGVTAPGRTPRSVNKRSADPNYRRPVPKCPDNDFRSICLSCSATKKILRFLWLSKYRFLMWPSLYADERNTDWTFFVSSTVLKGAWSKRWYSIWQSANCCNNISNDTGKLSWNFWCGIDAFGLVHWVTYRLPVHITKEPFLYPPWICPFQPKMVKSCLFQVNFTSCLGIFSVNKAD